ncbi:MAG: universal stress protein [Pseudomonadales bacterium]
MTRSNFLVAVDLTDESDEVLSAAKKLADGMDATLSCMTVVQPLTGLLGDYDFVPAKKGMLEFEEDALKQANAKLLALAAQFEIASEHVYACIGKPSTEVCRLAAELPAAMIVIGNHRRRGLDRLLGSTARALLCESECDVVVVNIHPFTDTQE